MTIDARSIGTDRSPAPDRLSEVVYALTHDLKAPTRHITSFAALLSDAAGSALDERSSRYLDLIVQAAAEVDHKLDGLNRYAAIVGADYCDGSVDPVESAHDALKKLAVQGVPAGDRVTVEPMSEVGVGPDRLTAILVELIGNSLNFCPPSAHVSVSASSCEGVVKIVVGDDGPGFGKGDPNRAFRLFKRLDRADRRGSGVGLSIARDLVESVGGRIELGHGPDGGAEVTLSLPAAHLPDMR